MAGAAVGPPPPQWRRRERQGRGLRFFPRCSGARAPESDCKPGSVPARGRPRAGEDHSSRRRIAAPLERSDPDAGRRAVRRGRVGRVTLDGIPIRACSGRGLPRRRSPGCRAWALTPRFQPCLCLPARREAHRSPAIGGVVSVALSLGLPRVVVNDLPTLRSPDFPPADGACPPAILRPPPAAARVPSPARPKQIRAALRRAERGSRPRGVARAACDPSPHPRSPHPADLA